MKNLQEDKLTPIVIDLTIPQDQINESFLRMFGASIELIIKRMFGLNNLNFKMRGNQNALTRFADTLNKEVDYIKAYQRAGLDKPSVLNSKWKLDRAIRDFETSTGIKWPIR